MGDVGALGLGSALALLRADAEHPAAAVLICGHQRDRGRLGGRADGRVQGSGPQAAAVPDVADPPPLRAGRLAGDDGDHPLLADLGDLRGRRARHLHRRLHRTSPAARRDCARATDSRSPGRRRCARCGARGSTSSSSTTTSTTAGAALAADLGVELRRRRPDDAGSTGSSRSCDLVVPGAGRARDAPPCIDRRRRAGVELASARSSWRTGGSRSAPAARGRCSPSPAPTARRRRRCSTVEMLRAAGVRAVAAGNTDVAARRRDRPRRRRVRRRVHELPAGVDADVPRRRRGVAQPRARPPQLARRRWRPTRRPRRGSSASQRPDDVAIGFADDPVVMAPPRRVRRAGTSRSALDRRRLPTSTATGRWPCSRARRATSADVATMRRAPAARHHERVWPPSALGARDRARRSPPPSATALGHVRRPAAPHRARRRRRRRAVVQRLEGDDAARRVGGDPGVRPRRADRRRLQQGPRPVADGGRARTGCAPWSRSARPAGDWSSASFAGVGAGRRRRLDGRGGRAGGADRPRPATPCCCRPAAPASTGTRRRLSRPAATTSARLVDDASVATTSQRRSDR